MDIHKDFVNQIVIQRKARVKDLVTGDNALQLERLKASPLKLFDSLDRILYTIDFLERSNLIKCVHRSNNEVFTLFNGLGEGISEFQVNTLHFLYEKLKDDGVYAWEIEMLPGLFAFVKNKYRTDAQVKESNNVYLAVGVAILSSALTALLTAWLT